MYTYRLKKCVYTLLDFRSSFPLAQRSHSQAVNSRRSRHSNGPLVRVSLQTYEALLWLRRPAFQRAFGPGLAEDVSVDGGI